jgi:CheY-like chemotaxis protein
MNDRSDTLQVSDNISPNPAVGGLVGKEILLAEDCPDQQRLLATLLQNAGAKVTLECNGEAAVDAIARETTIYDAIVMDFAMPVMDGIEATRTLRQNGYRGPIVAITAHDCKVTKDSWQEAGSSVYLTKPFDLVNLVPTLQQLVAPC